MKNLGLVLGILALLMAASAGSTQFIKTDIYHTGCQIVWIGQIINQNDTMIQLNCSGGILIGRDGTFERLVPKENFNITIMRTAIR